MIADRGFKGTDLETMRRYFYSFWYDRNPADPQGAWEAYYQQIKKVNRMFGTSIRAGYETDRGRVYLEYGPPDDIANRPNEPSSYPYQIWHYYKAKEFNNKRFVFYDPNLMGGDYELLHSDVPGEIRNRRWRAILQKRNTPTDNVDRNRGQDHYGGRADDYFTSPR